MQKIDIREQKKQFRIKSKQYRESLDLSEKKALDALIAKNLLSVKQIIDSKTILCYMSTKIEVETDGIINRLLKDKKTVAVPRCADNVVDMDFYVIGDINDTEKRTFGVREPIISKCDKLRDFRGAVCVIPALGFDREGFRLGYGKGCYDRFLSGFKGLKIGICYENCVYDLLPHGFYDIPADLIVTEKGLFVPNQEF